MTVIRVRKLVPLRGGPAVERRFVAGCKTLVGLRPDTPRAFRTAADLEHRLLGIITAGGLRAAERTVGALKLGGPAVTLAESGKGRRAWAWLSATADRELTIRVWANRTLRMTSLRWTQLPPPLVRTPSERARDERQAAFYAAYESIASTAYGPNPRRLSLRDRTILLVGEFEADVNNGGFGQYVGNKGRARAAAALRALRAIGALRTAQMLEAALKPGVSERDLHRLDARFYSSREDLAVLTLAAVQPFPKPSKAPR